ncbi:MAG: extracellular solute-binding protein [Clostridiales bacterium]|nr:extracellular solute-binding protein [Clostridiales bacterium]
MKTKSILTLILCAFMSLAMIAGCTQTGTQSTATPPAATQKATDPPEQTEAPEPSEESLPAVPFEEKFEFDILQGTHPHGTEQNRVRELIQEKTNTKINWTIVAATGWAEKANVTLVSGVLPDLVYFYSGTAVPGEWISQKAVIELSDLLDKAPNIQRWLTDDVMLWMRNPDGNIYQLNMVNEFSYNLSNQIRVDWLEKLNLEMPNTLDEWLNVLRAFRDGDPDGNGTADTIPWVYNFTAWFDAFGINNGEFVDVDGHLIPRYLHPNYKDAVELLASMYQEKLIDPEFVVRNKDVMQAKELLLASKAGAWQNSGSTASSYTSILRETNPDATFGYAPLIEGPGGQNVQGRNPVGACGAITVQAEEPEKLMAYWNWIYGDEGLTIMNYGEEGVHYELKDGKPVFLAPYYESFEINRNAGMAETWVPYVWLEDAFMQVTLGGNTPDTLTELDTHTYECYFKPAEYAYFAIPAVLLDTEEYRKLATDTLKPLKDMEEQVIAGNATWADMEELMAEVKDDLDAITASVDANYQNVK